ncbi:hypothetical protein yc1106_09324 [Curvularia clavata]|uniref:XPG-I domain-containing protein n=1 Tax=Curvularia clavata TaxID=95742 RepID=A0A9Q8ZH20_CURCL|nr:hypothetical protein yc1106_09324 [Curvularia clavata]
MGLPARSLWDTIRRHEDVIPIAQLAEDHHRRHGKPLRIAVDEADWRFNNLTAQQVYMIRDISNQQAFQGIEKAMFYRLCRLLTLNIQLIFVFDGPGRPWKRGKRGQGRINYEERRLLQDLLKYLGVPYHEAPGEAEAECARLQVLGLVDAVWSQDSDSLMFGCTLWLHDHRIAKDKAIKDRSKDNTKKNGKYACLVRAADLREKYKLDREGFVLFAMLVGGDYDTTGLPRCGPGIALQAMKQGLGKSLCECRNQQECYLWSRDLALFLQSNPQGQSINVPSGFPDYQTLTKYYRPKVTSDRELLTSSTFNLNDQRPIQEHELLKLTSERFNIWGRLYMNWIGPILLTRDLVSRESKPKELVHDIRFPKQRSKKTEEQPPVQNLERKLTFSPFGVSCLHRTDFEGEKFGHWNGDDKVLFDPNYRVECEMPEYWLRKTLPDDAFNPSVTTPKPASKRKRAADDAEQVQNTSHDKTKYTPHKDNARDTDESPTSVLKRPRLSAHRLTTPAKSGQSNSPNLGKAQQLQDVIDLLESDDEGNQDSLGLPSKKSSSVGMPESFNGFGASASSSRAVSSITRHPYEDPTDFDISDEEDAELQYALQLSLQQNPNHSMHPPSNRGKFEDIFAMREAGRNVQGSSVPAWELGQRTDDLFSTSPSSSSRRSRGNLSTRDSPSIRGTHANLAVAGVVEALSRYSQQPNSARSPVSRPTEEQSSPAGQKASAPVGDSLADVRAARLRHFATAPVSAVGNASSEVSSASVSKSAGKKASRKVPEGIECIDLTDD